MEQDIALYFWGLKDSLLFDIFKIISSKLYISVSSFVFIIFAIVKLKKKAALFLLAAAVSIGISDLVCYRVLKPAIKRPRPSYELNLNNQKNLTSGKKIINKNYYSMPSNHASNIFVFFVIYFCYVRRFWSIFFINSLLISTSRIIIVKHYPTDVLAGIAVGSIIGLIIYYLFYISGFKSSCIEEPS